MACTLGDLLSQILQTENVSAVARNQIPLWVLAGPAAFLTGQANCVRRVFAKLQRAASHHSSPSHFVAVQYFQLMNVWAFVELLFCFNCYR
jgi:hypothetical protein